MVYQCNDKDDYMDGSTNEPLSRKSGDSEIIEEDDFIVAGKRQKHLELSKCQEFDKQFHFGSSPDLTYKSYLLMNRHSLFKKFRFTIYNVNDNFYIKMM